MKPLSIESSEEIAVAAAAIRDLLHRFRIEHCFVGDLAVAAWLGEPARGRSVDLLAAVSPDRAHQIPMMAQNNGFEVDPERVEEARELDLIPLTFPVGGTPVAIHVLMASNTLYAKMIPQGATASFEGGEIQVLAADDLALLLVVAGDDVSRDRLARLLEGDVDRRSFRERLVTLGLGSEADE